MDRPNIPPRRQSSGLKEARDLLNQVFEIEKKLARIEEDNSIDRNLRKVKDLFENGLFGDKALAYENPLGEKYDETRTDCEAEIAGESAEDLIITEVIKPIVRLRQGGRSRIVQQGLVIAQSKNKEIKADEQEN